MCRSVTFQLKTLTGTLARGACPGTKYRLVVSWVVCTWSTPQVVRCDWHPSLTWSAWHKEQMHIRCVMLPAASPAAREFKQQWHYHPRRVAVV